MEKKSLRLDAGLASLDHYKVRLPRWRYRIRQALLPIVRWETPYVALLQERMRSSVLDSYFAMSANLGTHTAFMLVLPILFWCGNMSTGRGMVHMLASGVFFSGWVKDLLCLPRPLSPPLTRITMSGSAALEYGFPSTHSTNAISVAYYALYMLKYQDPDKQQTTNTMLQVMLHIYAISIVLGRLYCGMHGFFDVVIGSLLGAVIGAAQCHLGPVLDDWLYTGSVRCMVLVVAVVLVLVRTHPEPADDCPCFDDSVAFAGVVLGCEFASWHIAGTKYTVTINGSVTAPYSLESIGILITVLRIVLGVVTIFVWRASMKSFLLKCLPPLFRVIEQLGLDLPRRYFIKASQYTFVPKQRHDDNVIPSARDIPGMLSNLGRRRAVSVGPQSEADAYEVIAYREKRRRDSLTSQHAITPLQEGIAQNDYFLQPGSHKAKLNGGHTRRRSSSVEEFRRQMAGGIESLTSVAVQTPFTAPDDEDKIRQKQDKELFSKIQTPRVRYDVEVVTKLIIYAGIAWIAIEGNPMLFYHLGWSG